MATLHQSGYARGGCKRACGTMNFVVILNLLIRPKRKRLCNNTPTTSSHQSPAFTSWGKGRTATQAIVPILWKLGANWFVFKPISGSSGIQRRRYAIIMMGLQQQEANNHVCIQIGTNTIPLEPTLVLFNFDFPECTGLSDLSKFWSPYIYIYIWIYPTIHHYHHHPYFQCKI